VELKPEQTNQFLFARQPSPAVVPRRRPSSSSLVPRRFHIGGDTFLHYTEATLLGTLVQKLFPTEMNSVEKV